MQDLSRDDLLDVAAERRRQVVVAFVLGSEASQDRALPRPLVPQLAGLGVALTGAIGIGLVGLVQQQIRSGQTPATTPTAAPSIQAMATPTAPTAAPLFRSTPPTLRPPTTAPPRPKTPTP